MFKFPNFRQLDTMDCGPACLKIISKHYGKNLSMKRLRDLCNINREGVSLLDISRAADNIGLRSFALRATHTDLEKKIPLPCIIHWEYSHFVVVYKVNHDKTYVSDPRLGLVSYKTKEFCDFWKKKNDRGYVLAIEPSPKFYDIDADIQDNRTGNYFSYLMPYKKFLIQVFFGMVMGVFLNLLFPFITQSIVDIGIENKDYDFINILLFASIVLSISSAVSNFVQSRIMLFVADRINISMVSNFINKLMNLPLSFFERKMTSDILARVSDHNRIQSFVFETFLSMTIAILSFVVYSIILVYYQASLFFVFISGSLLYTGWIFIFLKRRRRLDSKYFGATVVNQNEIIQVVDGIDDIKVNNLQQRKKWDWEQSRMRIFNLNIKMLNLLEIQNIGTTIIDNLKNVLITFFSAKAVIDGDMTLGMMLAVQYIIGQMNGPVGKLIGYIHSYQDARISMERVNEVMHDEKEEIKYVGPPFPSPENISIKIENLSFSYHSTSALILDNISLVIPEGKMTAIVGASGSGKSTLLKLLMRFYDSYTGKISVGNGIDLQSVDIDHWRSNCGSILQNGKIFSDTILKNIVLDDENINIDKLNEAIDTANLREFIESKPLKLYTLVGHGGNGISGGQAQRLLIARAVYKDPKLLLMDEATNALDAKNEREITLRLLKIFKNKTTVVIAHRLSTIQAADQIIVFNKGKIVECGTHEELMVREEHYYDLISNQIPMSNL